MLVPSRRRFCRLTLALPAWVATAAQAAPSRRLTIGTAGLQSDYHPIGVAVCRMVNASRKRHGLRCVAELSGGSVANIQGVASGDVTLGLAQGDTLMAAREGTGPFAGKPQPGLRSLCSLATELFTIVVSSQATIRAVEDLAGKRVSLGPPGSGTRATSDLVLAAHGLRAADLAEVGELKFVELAAALCEHKIDAFMFVAGHPNPVFRDAIGACGARFVGIADPRLDALVAGRPYYQRAWVPVDLYSGKDAAVATVATTAGLFTDASLPDDVAYAVTQAALQNVGDLRRLHSMLAGLTLRDAARTTLPLHDGAAAYFRDAGVLP